MNNAYGGYGWANIAYALDLIRVCSTELHDNPRHIRKSASLWSTSDVQFTINDASSLPLDTTKSYKANNFTIKNKSYLETSDSSGNEYLRKITRTA